MNRMWRVSFTPESGPTWVALVKAKTMEEAIEKARPYAEEAGINRDRQDYTLGVTNAGGWPSAIIP